VVGSFRRIVEAATAAEADTIAVTASAELTASRCADSAGNSRAAASTSWSLPPSPMWRARASACGPSQAYRSSMWSRPISRAARRS
jgi:hypothetical protein